MLAGVGSRRDDQNEDVAAVAEAAQAEEEELQEAIRQSLAGSGHPASGMPCCLARRLHAHSAFVLKACCWKRPALLWCDPASLPVDLNVTMRLSRECSRLERMALSVQDCRSIVQLAR